MENTSIQITLVGRKYPVTLKKEDERLMKQACELINAGVKEYEQAFLATDKQDVLAMFTLKFITQHLKNQELLAIQENTLSHSLIEIDRYLSNYLKAQV